MRRLTLLIDIDDTVESLCEAWVVWLDQTYGYSVNPGDVTEWDLRVAFPELTIEQIMAPLMNDHFWTTVPPKPGAREFVKRLIDDGHDVYFVTASDYRTIRPKMENMLFRYFPYISWERVIVSYHKQMIRGDIMIDDGVHNLEGAECLKILMTAQHNKGYDADKNGMIRMDAWSDVYSFISAYASMTEKE